MSPKDIRHYKFLRRAIEFKYRFPDQSAFETFSYDPYIFRWASNTFYELKLFDYLDIRERAVLVRVYENLKRDPRLKFLDNPDSLKDKIEFKLPESFHVKIASEQAKLSAQAPTKTPKVNVNLPKVSFGAGNVLRNLNSQSQIFLKKNVFGKILTPTRLVTGFTTILGGIAGSVLGPPGTLAGAGAGFLTPSYVKTFGARHLGGLANWSADSMVRLSSQTSRFSAGGFGGKSVTGKRFAIAAILLFLGVGALAAFAPLPGHGTSPAGAASTIPTVTIAASCPIVGGQIKTSSYQISPEKGHCSLSYGSCPADSRRAKSIDVDTQGQDVIFPTISGQKVNWTYLTQFRLDKPADCEGGPSSCGIGVVFQTTIGADTWILHLLHLDVKTAKFKITEPNESGSIVGKTTPNIFLHINIGKNIKNAGNPPAGSEDLDPGWAAPDFMCQ